MELIITPKNLELNRFIKNGYSSFLFGYSNYSNNMINQVDVRTIIDLKNKYQNIKIFIMMNKNIFNDELNDVKKILLELDKIGIDGLFYYDLGILNICTENNIKVPLIWNQTYMVTNYNTCNYYMEKGVKGALLSSEITLDEMLEIADKTKIQLFVNLFCYPVMSHSNRKLLSNYFNYNNINKEKDIYTIKESLKNDKYFVKEDSTGTSFYNGILLNSTKALFELKKSINYGICYEEVDEELFYKIIDNFNIIITTDCDSEKMITDMNNLIGDYTGFYFKKTIYKVKKNG